MKLKNRNILCSVSAGYSSVYMATKIKEWYPNHNIIYVMANTSKEREESLVFMNECDKYFKLNVTWVEADIKVNKRGTSFNIVKFENLKRNGELFIDGIKKFGIPCLINKWCNRDLKLVPLKKYADSIFGRNNYSIAVGIRADEADRFSKNYASNNIFYPLIDNGFRIKDRNQFWENQKIQITIPAYKGNCDMCFEKSDRKLCTIIEEDPKVVDWWKQIELDYSHIEIKGKEAYNSFVKDSGMFPFRSNRSINELIKLSNEDFKRATDEYIYEDDDLDKEGECAGGCVVFT